MKISDLFWAAGECFGLRLRHMILVGVINDFFRLPHISFHSVIECGEPILDRKYAHLYNKRFDTFLFALASFHIEMYTSLNIKGNNWDFVMMSEPKKYYIGFLLKSINFVANT